MNGDYTEGWSCFNLLPLFFVIYLCALTSPLVQVEAGCMTLTWKAPSLLPPFNITE